MNGKFRLSNANFTVHHPIKKLSMFSCSNLYDQPAVFSCLNAAGIRLLSIVACYHMNSLFE